jgi:hypothetical protein
MDNEGLLAWSEYEVGRAREVLDMATTHMRELREIVRRENKAKRELVEVEGDIHSRSRTMKCASSIK